MSADTDLRLFEQANRPEDELVSEAHGIVLAAQEEHKPTETFILYSGGNDSAVVLDVCTPFADAVVFINTGIAIPDAVEHARATAGRTGLPVIELEPPESYESLVLGRWDGLPGPGAHRYTYQRLKERAIEGLLRDRRSFTGERFMLLTGVRKAESKRRMGYKDPVNRKGGQVWVNPLLNWSNTEMLRYRIGHGLPVNPVSANLHMSGECMCGAMADQDQNREERAAIAFFYPEFDDYLSELEHKAYFKGCRYTEWGVKRPADDRMDPEVDGQMSLGDVDADWSPLCQSCEFRNAEAAS